MAFFLRRKAKGQSEAPQSGKARGSIGSRRVRPLMAGQVEPSTEKRIGRWREPEEQPSAPRRLQRLPESEGAVIHLMERTPPSGPTAEDVPEFRLPASAIAFGSAVPTNAVQAEILQRLRNAFTPSRPKRTSRLFSGRFDELRRVVSAIEEERAHVVIYAERGRGKTSLANVISEIGENAGYLVLRYSCNSTVTFEDIFRSLLREIPMTTIGVKASEQNLKDRNYEQLLPLQGKFGATELTKALRGLDHMHVIFLIDEFDRVVSEDLKNQIAESIKNLSDLSAHVTFVILGVAHNLEELLGKHPSIQRNIIGILLPPMRTSELRKLIAAGAEEAGMQFTEETIDVVITLSKGLPYYAQLLCLHGGRIAIERGSLIIEKGDIEGGLDRILTESDRLVIETYERVTEGGRNQFQKDVLFAAAFCDTDEYDTFTAADAAHVFENSNEEIHLLALQKALSVLATVEKGPALKKITTPSGVRYGFLNQTMRQYILVRQARERGMFD